MAFQISPGVNVAEVDATTVVPAVQQTAGAFAGTFQWGPADKVKQIDSEITLASTYGKPNSDSAVSFFTAANFLSYGNNLSVVRAVGALANNATDGSTLNVQIKNEDVFESTYLNTNNGNSYGPFAARYAGVLGNSINIAVCANTQTYSTWAYKNYFTSAPGTSDFADSVNGVNDEMHIVVIDQDGLFTGSAGAILETYGFVSAASDAVINGVTNYYKQVIFNNSKYVYAMDPVDYAATNATWGQTAAGRTFANPATNQLISLITGSSVAPTDGNLQLSYDLFANKESIDVALVLTGGHSITVQQYVIDNIAVGRADCVAFISPRYADVVNKAGSETTNIQDWLATLSRSSSYVVADSGWKYQFDKYNNTYRWIPLNGDIAGLCVYTDNIRDPWFSPAGFNRGAIKNCIKLAWNPNKSFRDTLYAAGVNPVVSFPGQGTVLFGDKTLLNKPSAFDRINVRRLFITLEKAIAQAAKFSMFELNDEFTRAQFIALVSPFLRDIQGRRGLTDFRVVCDSTNNTQQVIDSNQFVGDIYLKPARSVNYIQLNFIAVGTGVDFVTIVGAA
jgi:hypothetical protein